MDKNLIITIACVACIMVIVTVASIVPPTGKKVTVGPPYQNLPILWNPSDIPSEQVIIILESKDTSTTTNVYSLLSTYTQPNNGRYTPPTSPRGLYVEIGCVDATTDCRALFAGPFNIK